MGTIDYELVAEFLYDAAWASVEEEPPVQWCDLTDERTLAGYRGQAYAFMALLGTCGYGITKAALQ